MFHIQKRNFASGIQILVRRIDMQMRAAGKCKLWTFGGRRNEVGISDGKILLRLPFVAFLPRATQKAIITFELKLIRPAKFESFRHLQIVGKL